MDSRIGFHITTKRKLSYRCTALNHAAVKLPHYESKLDVSPYADEPTLCTEWLLMMTPFAPPRSLRQTFLPLCRSNGCQCLPVMARSMEMNNNRVLLCVCVCEARVCSSVIPAALMVRPRQSCSVPHTESPSLGNGQSCSPAPQRKAHRIGKSRKTFIAAKKFGLWCWSNKSLSGRLVLASSGPPPPLMRPSAAVPPHQEKGRRYF